VRVVGGDVLQVGGRLVWWRGGRPAHADGWAATVGCGAADADGVGEPQVVRVEGEVGDGFFVAHAGGDARVGAAAVLGRAGEIEVAQVAGEKVDVAERVGEAGQHAVVGVVLVEDRGRAAALRPATDEAVPTPREDGGGVDGQAGPARAFGEFDGGAAEAGDPPDVEVVRDVGIFGHGEVDVVVVHGDAGGAGLGACERH